MTKSEIEKLADNLAETVFQNYVKIPPLRAMLWADMKVMIHDALTKVHNMAIERSAGVFEQWTSYPDMIRALKISSTPEFPDNSIAAIKEEK